MSEGDWNKLHGTVAHMNQVQAKEALHRLVDLAQEVDTPDDGAENTVNAAWSSAAGLIAAAILNRKDES